MSGSALLFRDDNGDLPDEDDPPGKNDTPDKIDDFYKLRQILAESRTSDFYCHSALYFAFTGRGSVWILKCDNSYLILLPHPNLDKTLLVFFPFVCKATEFIEQVQALCDCKSFLKKFQQVLLARIPESVVHAVFQTEVHFHNIKLEKMDEKKLDWGYPSYDVDLQQLKDPQGGKLKTFRKKIRKFCDQGIEVIRAKKLSQVELQKAVSEVNKSWIRTKLKSGVSLRAHGITLKDLLDPYRTLARLNRDLTSQIDGLILKRGKSYIAFGFWERLTNEPHRPVPCSAPLFL